MYCVVYFKAYDNVINGIKERFHKPEFEIYNPTNTPQAFHVETTFQRGIHVVCLQGNTSKIFLLMQLTKNNMKILSVDIKKCMKEIFIESI